MKPPYIDMERGLFLLWSKSLILAPPSTKNFTILEIPVPAARRRRDLEKTSFSLISVPVSMKNLIISR